MDVVEAQQTYATTTSQMMMKVTMTSWMMKTPLPKPKRIPILPTHKWEDGGYGQRLFHRCRSVFALIFVSFSPNLGDWLCVFGVCFFQAFFLVLVCLWNELFFLSKYYSST